MKRVLAISTVLIAAVTLAFVATGADDGEGSEYTIRAIFDNASFVIPGEDLKIAGVKVGKVKSVDVTSNKKAAIAVTVTEPGFQDFRQDATCTIRPQSLIGERFVECTPTAPRKPGEPKPPPLQEIKDGPGKGELNLPLSNTSTPVDIDLINNTLRKPYSERLSLIISSLGVGLAGNGAELNAAIKRANPAIGQVDKVLNILANQNQELADLAKDGDTVLAPLARERARVADFVVQANTTAEATAEKRGALEAGLQRFPTFLRELRPTMVELGNLADEMTPVLRDLNAQAPNINRFIQELGPFSRAARPAVRSLGEATEVGGPALTDARPILRDLDEFTLSALPVAENLETTLTSVKETGGIERLMDYIFFQAAAVNGFDSLGRYLRAGLIVNLCSSYAVTPVVGCSSNFAGASSQAAAAGATGKKDPILERTRAVLRGKKPEDVLRAALEQRAADKAEAASGKTTKNRDLVDGSKKSKKAKGAKKKAKKARAGAPGGAIALPPVTLPGGIGQADPVAPSVADPRATGAPPGSARGAGAPAARSQSTDSGLLDYLLGG